MKARSLLAVAMAATILAALPLAGCASSSGTSTASPSPSATATPPPTPAQVMTTYLARAKKVQAKYMRLYDEMKRVNNAHVAWDSTWKATGHKLAKLAKQQYGLETAWALIEPPKGLAAAHRAYGKNMALNRRWYQLASYCFKWKYDMSPGSSYGKQLDALDSKASDAYDTYRLAVSVKAHQLGVKIPWKWK